MAGCSFVLSLARAMARWETPSNVDSSRCARFLRFTAKHEYVYTRDSGVDGVSPMME